MSRRLSVDDWLSVEHTDVPDGSWITMMSRVANFHHKHPDLASASEMALSAAKIASLNVRVNLEYIQGEDVALLNSKIEKAVEGAIKSANNVALTVKQRLEW